MNRVTPQCDEEQKKQEATGIPFGGNWDQVDSCNPIQLSVLKRLHSGLRGGNFQTVPRVNSRSFSGSICYTPAGGFRIPSNTAGDPLFHDTEVTALIFSGGAVSAFRRMRGFEFPNVTRSS